MVPVLEKSIHIVRAIASGQADGSINQLARDLGIAPATCYRILQTLEQADWIRPRANGGFELSHGLLGMVHPLGNVERLVELMRKPLTDLAIETELAVKMSVRRGNQAITVFLAESPRPMALVSRAGVEFPLAIGSSGATLCSRLSDRALQRVIDAAPKDVWKNQTPQQFRQRVQECRDNRTCIDQGSFHPQIYAISGPLLSPGGEVLASVTIIGLPADMSDDMLPRLRRQLLKTLDICQQRMTRFMGVEKSFMQTAGETQNDDTPVRKP